jgi:hypothetical protein
VQEPAGSAGLRVGVVGKSNPATPLGGAGRGLASRITDEFRGGVLSTRSASIMGFLSFVVEVRAGAEVLASPRLASVITRFP